MGKVLGIVYRAIATYLTHKAGLSHHKPLRFRRVKAPTRDELTQLTHTIAHRVGRYLEHQGLLEHDAGNNYLTHFHGVFAPNSHCCALVTPAGRGKGKKDPTPEQSKTPAEQRASMTWAHTLKRVFSIDKTHRSNIRLL